MKKLRVLIVNINIAPERCGSITMSPDVSNKISKYGLTPSCQVCILLFLFAILAEKKTIMANLAISEGWKVKNPAMEIHLLALLRTTPIPGTKTAIRSIIETNIAGLAIRLRYS